MLTSDISVPDWIKSVQNFSSFINHGCRMQSRKNPVDPIKIAIIDDGMDATVSSLQSRIANGAGESFCFYPNSQELVSSYYVPSGTHGTRMAQLICDLCPEVQLYIARLEELPSPNGIGRRFTARSAAMVSLSSFEPMHHKVLLRADHSKSSNRLSTGRSIAVSISSP